MAVSQSVVKDTTRLACVCCGADNVNHRGFCSRCHTPLELSRSVESRGAPAKFLSVLGSSGAGKTVYLGLMLDMLTKGLHGLQGLPNDSFSVAMQQETIAALQSRRFPEKTPSEVDNWKWIHCEVTPSKKKNKYLDVVTPDLAGEAIALEVAEPGTYQTIQHVVTKSESLLILIDSQRARDNGRDEDYFAMKLFSYITSLHSCHKSRRGKIPIPIAVVFTKSDICPEAIEDPCDFARATLPGLVRYCERNVARYQFFAASVVGCSATIADDAGHRMRIPLHIEPHGVIEPIEWIMNQL